MSVMQLPLCTATTPSDWVPGGYSHGCLLPGSHGGEHHCGCGVWWSLSLRSKRAAVACRHE